MKQTILEQNPLNDGFRESEGFDNNLLVFRPCLSAWIVRSAFALPYLVVISLADFKGWVGIGAFLICGTLLTHSMSPLFIKLIVADDRLVLRTLFGRRSISYKDIKQIGTESGYYKSPNLRMLPLYRMRIILMNDKVVRFGIKEFSICDIRKMLDAFKNKIPAACSERRGDIQRRHSNH